LWGNENAGIKNMPVIGYKNNQIVFENEILIRYDGNNIYTVQFDAQLRAAQSEIGCVLYDNVQRCTITLTEDQRFCSPEEKIQIKIKYGDGTPVALSNYTVTCDDKDITPYELDSEEFAQAQNEEIYTIVNDSFILEFKVFDSGIKETKKITIYG